MSRITVLFLCLSLGSCMSVPISTIVRMSTFTERDFVKLDPDVLRVRISLPESFTLNPDKSSLQVRITAKAGVHDGEFKLDQESVEKTQLATGLFSGSKAGTAYALRLSTDSKRRLRSLQSFIGKGPPGDVLIAIKPVLASFPNDAASVRVWIDLLLSESQGYFTLLEAAEIPMEAIRAASSGS